MGHAILRCVQEKTNKNIFVISIDKELSFVYNDFVDKKRCSAYEYIMTYSIGFVKGSNESFCFFADGICGEERVQHKMRTVRR